MSDYSRLFEIMPYQAANFPQSDALNYKYDGKWRNYSSQECVDIINKASRAFIASGIQPGDKVAIISNNRPEWNFVDNGMMQVGAINVPIYPTISEREYKYIFNDAEIKMAFVSDAELFGKIKNIQSEVPTLKEIFSFEQVEGCEQLETFLNRAEGATMEQVQERSAPIKPEELATIIYTSGTTGNPKGVMLSHDNIVSNIKSVLSCLPLKVEHKTLSFLPLCHIFERTVTYTYMASGASCYYAESMETIGDNLKEVKPHFFSTVPRLLEKVYDKILQTAASKGFLQRAIFNWALKLGHKYNPDTPDGLAMKIADALVFKKWRAALGGNVMGIVTGAAACQERLARVFSAAGIAIREGYGQTESSPVITFNRFEDGGFKFGTVGLPIPGVEVKLGPNDEILCKGPNVMMGYYKNEQATNETLIDGWLHTGDVGTWVDNKFLKITGRVKELFKTSGGKYVAPEVIENKMKESRYIEQICVLGENQKFVAALVVPSFINLSEWATKNAVHADSNKELVTSPDVKELIQKEIEERNPNFGHVEQIKKFELLADEWSVESGELTPTMKMKRKVIFERYKDVIDDIYNV